MTLDELIDLLVVNAESPDVLNASIARVMHKPPLDYVRSIDDARTLAGDEAGYVSIRYGGALPWTSVIVARCDCCEEDEQEFFGQTNLDECDEDEVARALCLATLRAFKKRDDLRAARAINIIKGKAT